MSEVKTIYTDGVGKIHFFGNMLRLDLMDFVPAESEDANAKPEPRTTTRLVMSPNAFLASYESFMNMIDKLTKAGVLTPTEEKAEAQASDANSSSKTESEAATATVEEVK